MYISFKHIIVPNNILVLNGWLLKVIIKKTLFIKHIVCKLLTKKQLKTWLAFKSRFMFSVVLSSVYLRKLFKQVFSLYKWVKSTTFSILSYTSKKQHTRLLRGGSSYPSLSMQFESTFLVLCLKKNAIYIYIYILKSRTSIFLVANQ